MHGGRHHWRMRGTNKHSGRICRSVHGEQRCHVKAGHDRQMQQYGWPVNDPDASIWQHSVGNSRLLHTASISRAGFQSAVRAVMMRAWRRRRRDDTSSQGTLRGGVVHRGERTMLRAALGIVVETRGAHSNLQPYESGFTSGSRALRIHRPGGFQHAIRLHHSRAQPRRVHHITPAPRPSVGKPATGHQQQHVVVVVVIVASFSAPSPLSATTPSHLHTAAS